MAEIGSKPTYIKMSSESLDALKQAFLDPESRVRFPDALEERVIPKILAVRWSDAFLDEGLPLNPNLNCLIGGKGTGKSTAIETIRYAFDLSIQAPEVANQAEELMSETFRASSKVSLLVEVPTPKPTRYVVERTGRERPVVRKGETGEIISGLSPVDVMRPMVFGQKEIYETGATDRDPAPTPRRVLPRAAAKAARTSFEPGQGSRNERHCLENPPLRDRDDR